MYHNNRMSKAGRKSNSGTGKKKKQGKMTRKDAKAYKKKAQEEGHPAGNMRVGQIKRKGTTVKI